MRLTTIFTLFLFLITITLSASGEERKININGVVKETLSHNYIVGAVVELINNKDNSIKYEQTSSNGSFIFKSISSSEYSLKITMMGYVTKIVDSIPSDGKIGEIFIKEDNLLLESAIIKDEAIRSSQNGDTLSYNAAAYRVMMGSDSESLISKMPGISVSNSGVDANGRDVRKIMIDGQEFFGDDVLTALKNIPADLVSQIEVINQLSDNAELTGVDDGEGYTAINVVTKKKARNGSTVGRIYAGYGLSDKYIAGANINYLGKEQTASIIGMGNNLSKFNFTSSDLVGASTSDKESTSNNDFRVKPLPGISSVLSTGANYSNKWFSGSYFFNRVKNSNKPFSIKTTLLDEKTTQYNHNKGEFNALNYNHRFSSKISLSPANGHKIIIRPAVDIQDMSDNRIQQSGYWKNDNFLRNKLNKSDNDRFAIQAGASLSYRYNFAKRGRSFAISASGRYYKNLSDEANEQYSFLYEDSDFNPLNANSSNSQNRNRHTEQTAIYGGATYTEPLGKRSRISTEYKFYGNFSNANNLVYTFDKEAEEFNIVPDQRQSAINKNCFLTHSMGFRYNYTLKKMTVTANAAYQNVDFRGSSSLPYQEKAYRNFNNIIYSLIANLPINVENNLRIESRGRTINPSVNTMQNVINLNNTSYIRAGNPNIKPTYIHDIKLRYIHTSRTKGSTISFSVNYLTSPNYICDSLVMNAPKFEVTEGVILGEGNQYVKPINLGGYHKVVGKFAYGLPVKFLSSNLNFIASTTISRLPGIINGDFIPIMRNRYSLGLRLDSNINENLDFTIGYSGRYTTNEYSGRFGKSRNNYISQTAFGRIKWIIWKGLYLSESIQYDQDKNIDGKFNEKILLCDIYLGTRLFRNQMGELSIGVNDLFNDSPNIYHHSISASGSTDSMNQGIGRYFSIQFVYNLRVYNINRKK